MRDGVGTELPSLSSLALPAVSARGIQTTNRTNQGDGMIGDHGQEDRDGSCSPYPVVDPISLTDHIALLSRP